MFYVKETMGDAAEVKIDILNDEDSDLFGTAVLCENCTRRMMGGELDVN